MDGLLPFPALDWPAAMQVVFLLMAMHALMDFPLQGEFLSHCKNRHWLAQNATADRPVTIWPVCMAAHCILHALAVWAVTGCVILACIEFLLHGIIDVLKCEGKTGFNLDQLLHLLCKVGYVAAAALFY
jgi:hypothetical protein